MSRNRNKKRKAASGNTTLVESTLMPVSRDMELYEPIPIYEARGKRGGGNTNSKSFSLAWDETEALGITSDMRRSGPGMLSEQDRKETLYQAYLNSVWISACVDVIAKRITSGGMVIELTEKGTEVQSEYNQLHEFLHYINEDEDFLQLIRSIVTDLLIYGEAYMEIVTKAGKPFSLHKIDCSTMSFKIDQHGNILKYIQSMSHSNESIEFLPEEIIRWWLPDPKSNKKALSPIERILGSVDADAHMADWVRAFFRKGARPPFWIKFQGSKDEASRFVVWLRENYTGQANAHVPLVLYDNAELHEVGKGAVDMDFEKGRGMMRQEILAGYQVPPAIVAQIESGNIGGGTGESQDKSFQFNACDPIRQIVFEKFNYRIVNKGFNITNYQANTRYADFRNDSDIVTVQQKRVFSALSTPDEERQAMGRSPYPKGGDTPIVVSGREIIPLERLDEMAGEQREQTDVAIQQAHAQLDMTKVQIDKAKNPPPPPPTIVQAPIAPKKPILPDEPPQERYLRDLQQSITRVNEALARVDEHLRIVRTEPVPDGEQRILTAVMERIKNDMQLVQPGDDAREEILPETLPTEGSDDLPASGDLESEMDSTPTEIDTDGDTIPLPDASETENTIPGPATEETDTSEVSTVPLDENNRPEIVQYHAGMILALMLDPETANQLVIPNGEPADSLHITLAYMGSTEDFKGDVGHLKATIASFVATTQVLRGKVSGLGRFTPFYACVDMPGLPEFRAGLVKHLEDAGYSIDKTHGLFTPHVTLAYLPSQSQEVN